MPDDNAWHVGDLAECIGGIGIWSEINYPDIPDIQGPKNGDIDRVTGVLFEQGHLCLKLERWPLNDESFIASAFRKIQPPQHEACEPEFVTLVKRKAKEDA
jgi:hypothetical protein